MQRSGQEKKSEVWNLKIWEDARVCSYFQMCFAGIEWLQNSSWNNAEELIDILAKALSTMVKLNL